MKKTYYLTRTFSNKPLKNKKIMALKVKAKEQYQNIGKYAGTYRYVMMPELYTAQALITDLVQSRALRPQE